MKTDGSKTYIASFVFWTCVLSAAVVILGSSVQTVTSRNKTVVTDTAPEPRPIIVIDAGHGGEDGGAVSEDGVCEKGLNLAVSKKLNAMCNLLGMKTVMTRTDDSMLYDKYDDLEDYTGKKKTYDLRNRVRFTREQENPVFVSVHMNKFPDPRYYGTQVYYGTADDGSRVLAGKVRDSVVSHLQSGNTREIKPAGSSIYLLRRIDAPAVLIECGFLSNPEEKERLCDDAYQTEFSLAVASALCDYVLCGE